MDNSHLQQTIAQLIPDAVFNENSQFVEVVVPGNQIHQVAESLKNSAQTRFDFLFCLTGIDIKGQLGVVYHLRSTELGHSCVVKVLLSEREFPLVDSLFDVWPAAEFYEREAFDLLGIRFNNHPDLRRIFLDDEYQGFPLRKDFTDSLNIIER